VDAEPKVVNLAEKFGCFDERWTPKVIAESKGQLVKVAKFGGEFVWHSHADEDELFLVVKGFVDIWLRVEGQERCVRLSEGELLVVPKGVDHKPVAQTEAHVFMIEPGSTKHTGEVPNDLTVEVADQERI
jgi:mannose-6-phosphate isomerase-like protein (cupin superfamily)